MKESDLHREWARVLDMCEGTGVDPRACWKYGGIVSETHAPYFCEYPLEKYEFAVAILEKKPVFAGDVIYHKIASMPYKVRWCDGLINDNEWTWNTPKKTFMLNGEELPCPNRAGLHGMIRISANDKEQHFFYFNSAEDANKCLYAISGMLNKEYTGNGE